MHKKTRGSPSYWRRRLTKSARDVKKQSFAAEIQGQRRLDSVDRKFLTRAAIGSSVGKNTELEGPGENLCGMPELIEYTERYGNQGSSGRIDVGKQGIDGFEREAGQQVKIRNELRNERMEKSWSFKFRRSFDQFIHFVWHLL